MTELFHIVAKLTQVEREGKLAAGPLKQVYDVGSERPVVPVVRVEEYHDSPFADVTTLPAPSRASSWAVGAAKVPGRRARRANVGELNMVAVVVSGSGSSSDSDNLMS